MKNILSSAWWISPFVAFKAGIWHNMLEYRHKELLISGESQDVTHYLIKIELINNVSMWE